MLEELLRSMIPPSMTELVSDEEWNAARDYWEEQGDRKRALFCSHYLGVDGLAAGSLFERDFPGCYKIIMSTGPVLFSLYEVWTKDVCAEFIIEDSENPPTEEEIAKELQYFLDTPFVEEIAEKARTPHKPTTLTVSDLLFGAVIVVAMLIISLLVGECRERLNGRSRTDENNANVSPHNSLRIAVRVAEAAIVGSRGPLMLVGRLKL